MPKKYVEYSFRKFQTTFSNNEECEKHLRDQREKGFKCPRCGYDKAWYLTKRKLFDCKKCRFQTSLTAGTIFHGTKIPLVKWYLLIYRMAMTEHQISASEVKGILEIKHYRTAWLTAHKVRKAMKVMKDRSVVYRLVGLIWVDESFFGIKESRKTCGSKRKSTVLCAMLISRDLIGEERLVTHMQVMDNVSADNVEKFLNNKSIFVRISEKGKQLLEAIRNDKWKLYSSGPKDNEPYQIKVLSLDSKDDKKLWDCVSFMSSLKADIKRTHRTVSEKHLQSYLSEFCYRFNHRFRKKELFDRLLQACISAKTVTYNDLISKK